MAKKKPTEEVAAEYAKTVRALFDSFLKVGFTTDQAFALTLLLVKRD